MSFRFKGPNLGPQSGPKFVSAVAITTDCYTRAMSDTLRRAFDGCAKRLARASGANAETAKNWIDGRNGPSGAYLVRLMSESDDVLQTLLELAGKADIAKRAEAAALVARMQRLLSGEGV